MTGNQLKSWRVEGKGTWQEGEKSSDETHSQTTRHSLIYNKFKKLFQRQNCI